MYITGTHLSRRAVLKGFGATIALPFLDAMAPAGRGLRADQRKIRLMCVEMVHGSAGSFRSSAVFLTQAHPKQTKGADVQAGISLDQLCAQRFGQTTPIPSMQVC